MSELLQFGLQPEALRHPDADQLSAFTEQALPAYLHQETLMHLAVCPDCRAIVAMTMPVEAPAAIPVAEQPERRPWFAGWNFTWPIVAAMAALVLVIVYVQEPQTGSRNVTTGSVQIPARPGSQPQGQPAQSALKGDVATSAPMAPQAVSPQQAGVSGAAAKEKARSAERDSAASHAIALATPAPGGTITSQSVQDLPLQGRNFAALGTLSQAQRASGAAQSAGLGEAKRNSVISREVSGENLATAGAAVAASPVAPAPVAPAPVLQAANVNKTTTVEVNAAPTLTADSQQVDVSVASPTLNAAQLVIPETPRHPLPSRQPVLSMVEREGRVLAIDAEHAVFFSKDGGKHWKAVAVPWLSRAIKVDLTAPASTSGFSSRVALAGESTQGGSLDGLVSAKVPAQVGQGSGSLSGQVTDATGAAIPGATISVSGKAVAGVGGAVTILATTDAAGRFQLADLQPGTYSVEARATGFEQQLQKGVAVNASKQTALNLKLKVGAATQTVTVTAQSVLLDKTDSVESVKKKTAAQAPAQVFAITTDTGEHWTSVDGVNWERR